MYINSNDDVDKKKTLIYSLLLGGIVGNLIDRIIHGYVIDYISFTIINYKFPVFNFADICIVIAVIIALIFTVKEDLWN
jgi:signal peptidase II